MAPLVGSPWALDCNSHYCHYSYIYWSLYILFVYVECSLVLKAMTPGFGIVLTLPVGGHVFLGVALQLLVSECMVVLVGGSEVGV